MSSRTQRRGRQIRSRARNPLMPFYIALGAAAIIGVAALVALLIQARANAVPAITGTSGSLEGVPVGATPEGYYYKGDPNAPVTVTEYSDYQCPGCAYFALVTSSQITESYIKTGQVRLVYRDFPLINSHPNAVAAGIAARCAGEQGALQFWQMHDRLFASQQEWQNDVRPNARFEGYARDLGLDVSAYSACVQSDRQRAVVLRALNEPVAQRLQVTPSFEIGEQLVFPDALIPTIEEALR